MKKYLDIVNEVHKSPYKLTIVSSGGGTNAISALLEVPGASNTILESHIPYSKESMNSFLNKKPDHYCSLDTLNRFFANNCLILDKYVMGIFFLQILSSF